MSHTESVEFCGIKEDADILFDVLARTTYKKYGIIGSMIIGTDQLYIHGKNVNIIGEGIVKMMSDYADQFNNKNYAFKYEDGFIIVNKGGFVHKSIDECIKEYTAKV